MQTTIAGIPCEVTYSIHGRHRPAKTYGDPDDCYEEQFPEIDFEVCDRRGRPAPWLAKKMTDADVQRIEMEILEDAEDD